MHDHECDCNDFQQAVREAIKRVDAIHARQKAFTHNQLSVLVRLEEIEKRHAEHDAGLRAMATEPKLDEAKGILLPCPFCGSSGHIYTMSLIQCTKCMARGPDCDGPKEALAAWNRAKR